MTTWCHNDAVDLEAFELVLLRTPENAPTYDDAELTRIQAEHLAHHARLRASGQVVTNGPVQDQPDSSLRGLAKRDIKRCIAVLPHLAQTGFAFSLTRKVRTLLRRWHLSHSYS